MKTAFICVCSPERLSQYKVLYSSILKYAPNVTPILYYGGPNPNNIGEVINISDWIKQSIYREDWYTYTSIRPKAILDAFGRGYEGVVLLGSDTEFFSEPILMENFYNEAMVTMYTHEPYPDETLYPNNIQTVEVGQINADMIAFRNTPLVIKFLQWLDVQLSKHIVINKPYYKIYLDQTWFSMVFSMLDDVKVIRHLGYNVANYNLHNRGMRLKDEKWIMKDGSPLVLFHYAGFDPKSPEKISKHQNRYTASGEMLEFLKDYARKI